MSAQVITFPDDRIVRKTPQHFDLFNLSWDFACSDWPGLNEADRLQKALDIESIARKAEESVERCRNKKVVA